MPIDNKNPLQGLSQEELIKAFTDSPDTSKQVAGPRIDDRPFTFDEIEDVKLIIKANGHHYGIVPKGDKEDARIVRLAMFSTIIEDYYIVNPSLEIIKK